MSAGTKQSRWLKVKSAAPQATDFAVMTEIVFDRSTAVIACLAISLVSLSRLELHVAHATDMSRGPMHPLIVIIVFLVVFFTGLFFAKRFGWITRIKSALHKAKSLLWRSLTTTTAI